MYEVVPTALDSEALEHFAEGSPCSKNMQGGVARAHSPPETFSFSSAWVGRCSVTNVKGITAKADGEAIFPLPSDWGMIESRLVFTNQVDLKEEQINALLV